MCVKAALLVRHAQTATIRAARDVLESYQVGARIVGISYQRIRLAADRAHRERRIRRLGCVHDIRAPEPRRCLVQIARTESYTRVNWRPGAHVQILIIVNLGDLYAESGQTLQSSFSAISKPNFASKYSLESSRRDLQNALLKIGYPYASV